MDKNKKINNQQLYLVVWGLAIFTIGLTIASFLKVENKNILSLLSLVSLCLTITYMITMIFVNNLNRLHKTILILAFSVYSIVMHLDAFIQNTLIWKSISVVASIIFLSLLVGGLNMITKDKEKASID